MFRKLFAIETAALLDREADGGSGASAGAVSLPPTETARFLPLPATSGIWASRTAF